MVTETETRIDMELLNAIRNELLSASKVQTVVDKHTEEQRLMTYGNGYVDGVLDFYNAVKHKINPVEIRVG